MRTFFATRPRNGSSVNRPTEASTPRLCNSSTTRYRHCRPKPRFARYQPVLPKIRIATSISKRVTIAATRRDKVDRPPRLGATDFGGSRMVGISSLKALEGSSVPAIIDVTLHRFTLLPFHDNFRSASDQRVAQFDQHRFHLNRLVLDPARRMAPPHGLHDHGGDFIDIFSGRVHRLSRARWRKIDAFHSARDGPSALFRNVDFARPARLCDAALGNFNPHSGSSPPLGPPSAHRALDDPNLALCVSDRGAGVFDALQMVSSAKSCTRPLVDV